MAKSGLHRNGFLMGFGGINAAPGIATRQINTANIKVAFCLVPNVTKTLSSVGVYVSAVQGVLGASDMVVQICADNNFTPGSVLATGTQVDATPTGAALVRFTGLSQVLTAGTLYWIVISNAAVSPGSNNFTILEGTEDNAQGLSQMDAPFFGTRKTTTDGTTYSSVARRTNNILLTYTDATYDGIVWSAYAAETQANCVYATRELGNVFTLPSYGRLNLSGISMMVGRSGNPTGNMLYKVYDDSGLIGNTIGIPQTATLSGFSAFTRDNFTTPLILEPGGTYRVVIAETAQSDTSTNRYIGHPFTIPNDSILKGQMPFLGTAKKTYSTDAGATWTDTDTQAIPMYLIGDDLLPFATQE